MLRCLLPFIFAALALGQAIPLSEYAQRREKLRKEVGEGVIVLFALQPVNDLHDRNGFFQEQNFYYLTGWNEPNAALLLCGSCPVKEMFFLPKRTARREIYDGYVLAPGDADAPQKTGFATVLPYEKLEQSIVKALEDEATLYTLFDGHEAMLGKIAPLRNLKDVRLAITHQRTVKSEAELRLLRKAIDATTAAHFESWKAAKPGAYEYEVAASMQQTYFALGCERNAYPPIVGSGVNSVTLHYNANKRRMDSGDVLLMDVGGEYSMYAADITRTVPVNGTWSPRQKEVYDLVLAAQQAVIDAAKPGVMLSELSKIAHDYLDKRGKGPNGKPWGTYLPHGVSHHIGLDVHDPFDPALPLAEGNVITVEPGLYLKEEKLGVRIEDMILITKDGAKLLSGALPRTAAEVERRMKR